MPVPRLRFAWWFVMLGLSASLSLNYVLPLLNAQAAEYTPFHTHLLLGGSAADRAWLLAHHSHGAHQTQTDQTPAAAALPDQGATIINGGDGLSAVLAGAAGGELLAALDWPDALPPLALWALLVPAALFFLGLAAPPPVQPPRPA